MRLPGYRCENVLRGVLIYSAGDTAAALLTSGFSPGRLAGMILMGGLVYAWEIPAWFSWLDSRFRGLPRALMAVAYFNPLWIARHLAVICLASGEYESLGRGLLAVSLRGFALNLPVAVAANYLIQNKVSLKWRFMASAVFSALLAVYYPLCRVLFK